VLPMTLHLAVHAGWTGSGWARWAGRLSALLLLRLLDGSAFAVVVAKCTVLAKLI
jgi:hypothetical protein